MASIKLGDSQKLEISSFKNDKGELFLNLRKFYKTKNSEDWLPTKQGLTLPEAKGRKVIKLLKEELENIGENAEELEPRGKNKEDKMPKKNRKE